MIRYKSLIKKISIFLGVLLLVVSVFNAFSNSILFQSPKVVAAGNCFGLACGQLFDCSPQVKIRIPIIGSTNGDYSLRCAYLTPPCQANTFLYLDPNWEGGAYCQSFNPCPDQQTVNGVCMPVCDPPKVADTNPQSPTFQQCVGINAANDLSNGTDGNNPLPIVTQPNGTNVKPKAIYVMKNNGQANNAYRTNLKLDVLQNDGPNPSSLSADSISNIVYPAGNKGQVDPVVSDGGKFITITAPWGFSNAISNQPKTMSFNYKANSATQTSSAAIVTLTLKCFDDTKPNDPATDLPFDVNTLASEYNNDPNNINENFGLGSNYKFPGTPGQEYKFQVTGANGEIVKYTVPANLAGTTKAMAGQKRVTVSGGQPTPVDYLCPVLGNIQNPTGSYRDPQNVSNIDPKIQRKEAVKRVLDLISGVKGDPVLGRSGPRYDVPLHYCYQAVDKMLQTATQNPNSTWGKIWNQPNGGLNGAISRHSNPATGFIAAVNELPAGKVINLKTQGINDPTDPRVPPGAIIVLGSNVYTPNTDINMKSDGSHGCTFVNYGCMDSWMKDPGVIPYILAIYVPA